MAPLKRIVLIIFLFPVSSIALARVSGYCQQGNVQARTQGINSSNVLQGSYPRANVTAYISGTATIATIYANASGSPKSNPFTCDSTGYFFFYAVNQSYDLTFSGAGITTPFTWAAVPVFDPFQVSYVENFGAVGDGVTSDCTAFSAALASGAGVVNATHGHRYYLPCTLTLTTGQTIQWGPGTPIATVNGFIIPDSTTLKTAGNVAMIGQGSALTMLQQNAGSNQDFIRSNSFYSLFDTGNLYGINGFTLTGVTLDGNKANQTLTTKAITAVDNTTPLTVHVTSHGYTTGDLVMVKNAGNKPEASGTNRIMVTGANTFTLTGTESLTNIVNFTGDTTNGSPAILTVFGGLKVGALVVGTGVPVGATIISTVAGTSITLSANATATNSGVSFTATTGNIYTSGGVVTNGHGSCVAVYGINYQLDDLTVQECGGNGIVSSWGIAPSDGYTSPLDLSPRLTSIIADQNGFDGIRWHGPQWYLTTLNTFLNGGFGLGLDSYPGFTGASVSFVNIQSYGNADGAVWNNGGLVGAGLTPSPYVTGPGLIIARNGGGSRIAAANFGGGDTSTPLVNWSVDSTIQGTCILSGTPTGRPCVAIQGGYGNDFYLSASLSGGYLYSIYAESAANRFHSHVTLINDAVLFDPAHMPSTNDVVDTSTYVGVDEFWQDHRQFRLTPPSASHPGTVTTTSGSASIVGSGTNWQSSMIGGTITVGVTACIIRAVTDTTHLTCPVAFGANNTAQTYTLSDLPFFVTAGTGIAPNFTAHFPLYNAAGLVTDSIQNAAIITLNGASPSVGMFTFTHPFSDVLGTAYFCGGGLVKGASVAYTVGIAGTATALTLTGPNGATDNWSIVCEGKSN